MSKKHIIVIMWLQVSAGVRVVIGMIQSSMDMVKTGFFWKKKIKVNKMVRG